MSEGGRLEGSLLDVKWWLVREAVGLLLVAAAMLGRSQRFSRRAYALDGRGRSVRVDDRRGVRLCLTGVLLRAEYDRFGSAIAIETSAEGAVEDLLRPVLPERAPLRLRLAFELLACSARHELERLGYGFHEVDREVEPEVWARVPTVLHTPLLLGLDRRGGQHCAHHALVVSVQVLAWIASTVERLDELIPDEWLQEASA